MNSTLLARSQVEWRGLDHLINDRRTFDLLKTALPYKMNLRHTFLPISTNKLLVCIVRMRPLLYVMYEYVSKQYFF